MLNKKDFPVAITLHFATEKSKSEFLGGLLDGWGENAPINIQWNYTNAKMSADKHEDFFVTTYDPHDWD